MSVSKPIGLCAALLAAISAWADVRNCSCDPLKPETLEARECSLCREATLQPETTEIFFLKDINPRKPNRWLALTRLYVPSGRIDLLPRDLQTKLWKAAIEKGRQLWGDEWGLAYNGILNRTQCHTHIHIGKLLKGLDPGKWFDVTGPEHIRVPKDGSGVWVHPVGKKIRIHYGEGITETALLR
jgi:hypothetical protein